MSPTSGGDSWVREIEAYIDGIERAADMVVPIAQAVQRSIVEGSPVTGAPGQPVDTGALRASWQLSFPEADVAEIATNLVYAPAIEDGVGPHGPLTLRSAVGGFHSVAHTEANFDRLVNHVLAENGL